MKRRDLLRGAAAASVVTLGAALVGGCRRHERGMVVGFSQMDNQGAWRIAETNSLAAEAQRRGGRYTLVVADAQDQTAKQVSDVEDLIARRVKALFIAPREYEGLEPAFEAASRAQIPVFLIDREAAGRAGIDYVAFLGSNFVEQGRRAATWLGHTLARGGIVEITGSPGSSVAADRHRGFREGLAAFPGLHVIASQTGQFSRAEAQNVMENLIQGLAGEVQAVYGHNDEMALGAITALRAAGLAPGKEVQVVSIDGSRAALTAIVRGELGASVESNPRFGPVAFTTLERYLAHESIPTKIILEDRLFDRSNAARFVDQAY